MKIAHHRTEGEVINGIILDKQLYGQRPNESGTNFFLYFFYKDPNYDNDKNSVLA